MNQYAQMFDICLIDVSLDAESQSEVFEAIHQQLKVGNYVDERYLAWLKKREEEFPTGLVTQYLNIALPHTDPQVIKKPFIFVVRLLNGIIFKQMGDGKEITVKDIFFLGIKNPKEQVGLLQSFMELFMDEHFVQDYRTTTDTEELIRLLKEHI